MKKFIAVERDDGRQAYINAEAIDLVLPDSGVDRDSKKPYPVVHLIFPGNLKITIRETLDSFEKRWRGVCSVSISKPAPKDAASDL